MDHKKSTLSNGLPVLHITPTQKEVCAAVFFVRTGSRFETPETNGLSRFTALMSMKKTRDLPTYEALAEAVDILGAYINVEVSREYTAYYIKSITQNFPDALKLLSEIVIHPIFDVADISMEKQYFMSEIDARTADQSSSAIDELYKLIFGSHPIVYSGVGEKDSISGFSIDSITQFRDTFYTAQNSLLAVYADEALIGQTAGELFSEIKQGQAAVSSPLEIKTDEDPVKIIESTSDQVAIAMGFPAYSRASTEKYAQLLLDTVLGKTKGTNRLSSILNKEGLVTALNSGVYQFSDSGIFTIQLKSSRALCKKAFSRVLEELEKLAASGVTDAELAKAKSFYPSTLQLGLHDPVERAFFFGLQEFLEGNIESIQSYSKKLEGVSKEEIHTLAAKIFDQNNLYTAMVGTAA